MNISRFPKLQGRFAVFAIGSVLLLALGHSQQLDATSSSVVHISIDGDKQTVTTDADTVGEVLSRAEIEVGEHDLVEPSLDAEITSQVFNINVYRAAPVLLIDGDDEYKIQSAYGSARLIAENSGYVELHEEDNITGHRVENFLRVGHVGYKVEIERATPIRLQMGDKVTTVRTHATTVAAIFEELGIELGENDIIEPALDAPVEPDMEVSLIQIGFETVTEEEEIAPDTETVHDNNRPIGYENEEEPGEPGMALVTYEIEYRNGEEVAREEVRRVVEREAKPRVVVIGNQRNSYSDSTEKLLYDLRMCESGGRYNTNTGNGFYGAYQFMISTWDRVAPMVGRPDLAGVRPDQASPSDQDFMVVENAKLSAGGFHSQHPGCSNSLGLPKFP